MTTPRLVPHVHTTHRVLRHEVARPLDAAYSQRRPDNRWNTPDFPALYACCSLRVARAVAMDRLGLASVTLDDLTPAARPVCATIRWAGRLVDVASPSGVTAAGFLATYPEGVEIRDTQRAAVAWHEAKREGVVCRSASIFRLGLHTRWPPPHTLWGEIAVFVRNARHAPRLGRLVRDLDWLWPRPMTTR